MQFPDDLLHRPALNMEGSTNTRNRIHSLQLPLHPLSKDGWSDKTGGGSKLDAGHPARGVIIPRRNTSRDDHRRYRLSQDRKSTRLNSIHYFVAGMRSSACKINPYDIFTTISVKP